MWRWAVERDRRKCRRGGRRSGAHSEQTAQRGVVELVERQDFVAGLAQDYVRPLRAVCRRLLGVSEAVALCRNWRRGLPSAHRGLGRGFAEGLE